MLSLHIRPHHSRTFIAVAAATLLFFFGFLASALAAAGDLDPTFGGDGKVTTDFFGSLDEANAIAIQPDGKLVAAGFAYNEFLFQNFALARYNSDGSLDTSFGSNGRVVTALGDAGQAIGVAILPGGKILVVARAFNNAAFAYDFALVRYNSDGSLDPTFGSGGTVIFDLGLDDRATGFVIQPDGKIVVIGESVTFNPFISRFGIARFNSNGSLDASFANGGKRLDNFRSTIDIPRALALQPDGKIVAAGQTETGSPFNDFLLVRYNADGSIDSSFGAGGSVATDFFGFFDSAFSVIIQPDGKIIAGGDASPFFASADFGLARYNPDGSLDVTFGNGGKVNTDFFGSFNPADRVNALALQPDGKIVAAGFTSGMPSDSALDFALARYNSNGSLDVTFGSGGKVITDFFGNQDQAAGVVIQPDGKIVAAGFATLGQFSADFALARYEGGQIINGGFDICVQDDSSGNALRLNTTTGRYQFTDCSGLTVEGTGAIIIKGDVVTLQRTGGDHRVSARIDRAVNKASASLQLLSRGITLTITDRNTLNDTYACR